MPTVSSKPELCLCVCVCSITSYLHSSWSYFMRFRPVRRYQHLHIICARKWKAVVSTGAVVHRHCCDRAGRGGRGRKVLGPINKPVMRAQSRMVMRGEITCCIREKERERRGSKGGGDHARPCMIYCGDRNMRPCVYVCVCVRPVTHDSWSIDFCFHCDPAEPGSHHRCTVQRSCHSSSTSRGTATHTHVANTGKASRASLDRPSLRPPRGKSARSSRFEVYSQKAAPPIKIWADYDYIYAGFEISLQLYGKLNFKVLLTGVNWGHSFWISAKTFKK